MTTQRQTAKGCCCDHERGIVCFYHMRLPIGVASSLIKGAKKEGRA